MQHTSAVRSFASALSVCALVAGCAGTSERSESVEQVDELLTRIERVQAETAVAKDSVHSAFESLCTLVSPNYQGDAATAFAQFLTAAEASKKQGETLRDVCEPMCDAADDVFTRWTKDMEAFGNSRMRQRSQARLDETRTRFQSIVGAAQSAQIALDAFHADLQDHALYLRHDLNSAAVASIRSDVRALDEQVVGLDTRFAATLAAAGAYVESAALYGQIEAEPATASTTPSGTDAEAKPAEPATKKRTVTTLKPKAQVAPPASTEPTTPGKKSTGSR